MLFDRPRVGNRFIHVFKWLAEHLANSDANPGRTSIRTSGVLELQTVSFCSNAPVSPTVRHTIPYLLRCRTGSNYDEDWVKPIFICFK